MDETPANLLVQARNVADVARAYEESVQQLLAHGGTLLRETRDTFDLQQRELARHLRCSRTHLSRIETGRITMSRKILLRLFDYLRH